jgi:hypothetical protein
MEGPGQAITTRREVPLTAENTVAVSDLQCRLRRMIDLRGVTHVARELGLAREPVIRYLAGLDIQAGTRELIERKLTELGDETEASDVVNELAKTDPVRARRAAHERRPRARSKGGRR